jgi:hypothetical protein
VRIKAFLFLAILLLETLAACSDKTLKPPASDKNYDDMEDPNMMMMGVLLDAAADGLPDGQGKKCASSTECASPLRCIFPIALGCGAPGACALYTDPPNCAAKKACGCNDVDVTLCSPDGYATSPIKHSGACSGSNDASSE